jgi:hypothetical protein
VHDVPELELLLDNHRLNGVRGVRRTVGPERLAALVNRDELADARDAIRSMCLAWGGSTGLLVPHPKGADDIDARWVPVLSGGVIDELALRGLAMRREIGDRRFEGMSEGEHLAGDSLLAVLVGEARSRDSWPVLDARLPHAADPWHGAYLGVLGDWPESPEEFRKRQAGLVDDFSFDRLLEVDRGIVSAPGAEDLVRRLREPRVIAATRLCNFRLGLVAGRRAGDFTSAPFFTERDWIALQTGPNIVVVYEPGSVEDLCLLWNLRAVHAVPPALPLATPREQALESLHVWSQFAPGTQVVSLRGVVTGRPWAIISASVPMSELETLASRAGHNWTAIEPDELLQGGDRPGLDSTDIATFRDGQASVASFSAADRDLVSRRPVAARGADLRVRLAPLERRLPTSTAFLRFLPNMEGYQGGGQEFRVTGDRLLPLDWPSGWNTLRAVMRERGLDVAQSRPGLAAVALLRRLGSFHDVHPLCSAFILEELYRLGERSGFSYFKRRVRELAEAISDPGEDSEARFAALERELAEMRLRPFEGEQNDLTFDRLRPRLGRNAATAWLKWAEDRGLLVRGVVLKCTRCGARSWRTTADLAPPVVCPGCGEVIAGAFRPDHLPFRYRPSQLLLDVLALDVLPHVLTLRWLRELLGGYGLYGGHPGVEIREGGKLIGEADVVLLFSDASLALGECKLNPAALTDSEVEKHELLADRVGATWTFYSTPRWSTECGAPSTELSRRLPERVRCVLTAEQVLAQGPVIWAAGSDPFASGPAGAEERAQHEASFKDGLDRAVGMLQDAPHADQIILDEP